MKIHLFLAALLLFSPPLWADDSAHGTFETFVTSRPKPSWELLKGYRLFFHPDDPELMRRSLTLAIPVDRKVLDAYSLVRPLEPNPLFTDAWLRIEGEIEGDRILFSWDGTYRGAAFPDTKYKYEVHVRWSDGESLNQTLVVLKSLDHPKLIQLGDQKIGDHPLQFVRGEFRAVTVVASISKSDTSDVAVIARVLAPVLEGAFSSDGIQLSYERVDDKTGLEDFEANMKSGFKSGIFPKEPDWVCACQQALPPSSPTRTEAKKVQCMWDISGLEPGIYQLRLSLYHRMNQPGDFGPCDEPILDEDRIRVEVRP